LLVVVCGQFTTVAIVATNDIHGAALPTQMQRSDTKENYTYGGLVYMGSQIEIVKSEYPGHTLILDAGDQFQGGIESSPLISSGKIMNDFYDAVEVSGSAIGNHEFDFGPDVLLPYLQSKEAPTLAANIRSEKGAAEFLPQQKLSQIYEFKSGIRIGVIGLSTIFTPDTTNAFKDKKFPEYKFLNYTDIVVAESKKLKKNGANAVLIVGHLGNDCKTSNIYGRWTVDTKQEDCGVVGDEVTKLIDSLPTGTIDGILQGHRHKFAHHFYKSKF
jgi:2',3'-cyclic-nucleotide 2'-phosphodiesterase (5'-nucleotidase family)